MRILFKELRYIECSSVFVCLFVCLLDNVVFYIVCLFVCYLSSPFSASLTPPLSLSLPLSPYPLSLPPSLSLSPSPSLSQGVAQELKECWQEMVIAEKSVLVNILFNPEALFYRHTDNFKKIKANFLKRLVLKCNHAQLNIHSPKHSIMNRHTH